VFHPFDVLAINAVGAAAAGVSLGWLAAMFVRGSPPSIRSMLFAFILIGSVSGEIALLAGVSQVALFLPSVFLGAAAQMAWRAALRRRSRSWQTGTERTR
jgi:hypothetical protein